LNFIIWREFESNMFERDMFDGDTQKNKVTILGHIITYFDFLQQ